MPEIKNKALYNAIYDACTKLLTPDIHKKLTVQMPAGEGVYRYTDYRAYSPGTEDAARKIWSPLALDTGNRWTGSSLAADRPGFQGLYLSLTAQGSANTEFAELEHYLRETDPELEIEFYRYKGGEEKSLTPQKGMADVKSLKSMFLFTLKRELNGIDLRLSNPKACDFLKAVFDEAKKASPEAFGQDDYPSLYKNGDDASFSRAIGNAILGNTTADFFTATSVRSDNAHNMILRGASGQIVDVLSPQGRATWFLDPSSGGPVKKGACVYTIDDMIYNDKISNFSEKDIDGRSVKEIEEKLRAEASDLVKKVRDAMKDVDWAYVHELVDTRIEKEVREALSKMDEPYSKDLGKLVDTFTSEDLQNKILDELADTVWGQLIVDTDLSNYLDKKPGDTDSAKKIAASEAVEPSYSRIISDSKGPSYLREAVEVTVLTERNHYVTQHREQIQKQLADASSRLTHTQGEITARQKELEDVERKSREAPKDEGYKKKQKELGDEIARLEGERRNAEDARDAAERLSRDRSKEEAEEKKRREEREKRIVEEDAKERKA